MKNADVELIQRVLDGDDTAFSELVNKYYKPVHALAWRKVQDFHIAEDITQETFLKAYKNLSTLKEPQSFVSWLYVITTNRCNTYLAKKRLWTQSLEDTDNTELEKATYSNYVIAEKERDMAETQREVVKKLLAKLQESDRTVITLYYLGGMTYEEISKFLGVSVSAIKNRLYRARQFLKKEEPMIREALENYQITPHFTENIMQEISRLKPTPSGSKPLMPWAIAASSAILIVMLLGIGSQYLARFQQPYSMDTQTEISVELVDASVIQDIDTEPKTLRQIGSTNTLGQTNNIGQKPDEVLLNASQTDGEGISVPKQQWIQANVPTSARRPIWSLSVNPEGEVYTVVDDEVIGKLTVDGQKWQLLTSFKSNGFASTANIAKWNNTLYFTPGDKLFISKDEGNTWESVNSPIRSGGGYYNFVFTDMAFYLSDEGSGIYRSYDDGKSWKKVSPENSFTPRHLVSIRNILIANNGGGSIRGLYRFINNKWELLQLPVTVGVNSIRSLVASESNLYVMIVTQSSSVEKNINKQIHQNQERSWWLFRSTDIGDSWTDITPKNAWSRFSLPPEITLVAIKDTLLAINKHGRSVARSTNGGNSWTFHKKTGISPTSYSGFASVMHAVAINENTFYVGGTSGIHRSTDGGKSWHRFNTGLSNWVDKLYVFRRKHEIKNHGHPLLYSISENFRRSGDMVFSFDGGKSWKIVDVLSQIEESNNQDQYKETVLPRIVTIQASDGVLYAKGETYGESFETVIYRISDDGKILIPVEGMPAFNSQSFHKELKKLQVEYANSSIGWPPDKTIIDNLQRTFIGSNEFINAAASSPGSDILQKGLHGTFAVSEDTFFMEYNHKLFRWKMGEKDWYDTGVEDTAELTSSKKNMELEIAVFGATVYVGTRNGNLFQSVDNGDTWKDITPEIISKHRDPYQKPIRDIVFYGSKIYVETREGVITSNDGINWRVINNESGKPVFMTHLVADNAFLYGVSRNSNIYRLENDNGPWKQVATQTLSPINSIAVDGSTLYVGTSRKGVMFYRLEE